MLRPRLSFWFALLLFTLARFAFGHPAATDRDRACQLLDVDPTAMASADVATREFPGLGTKITLAKAIDRASGTTHFGAFDAAGSRVDLSVLSRLDAALVAENPSLKLTPALRSRLAAATPGEAIEVGVWLHVDPGVFSRFAAERMRSVDVAALSKSALGELEAELTIHAQARVAEVVTPFVADLAAAGLSLRYASTTAPALIVTGSAERIAALALRGDVDTIFDQETRAHDANEDANATHRTDSVHSRAVKGNGIRVAMLEDNRIDPSIPFLDVVATFDNSVPFDSHIQGTAGSVQSTQPGFEGAAPDVELLSACAPSYADVDVIAAGDWVVTQDADITNMSFAYCGTTGSLLDAYFDFQSRTHFDSYVAAAGNTSNCSGNTVVTSPGRGFNVITVGNFSDNENSDWADDAMNSGSCFVDPSSGVQKPNIAANGTNVTTLNNNAPSYQQTISGTSLSAPHATGNLACAMQVNSTPKAYPQAAMALMMATAWHNIEGATVLSDKDGAGGIDGYAAYRCADDNRVRGNVYETIDFDANDQDVKNVWLEADQLARVCFAWSSETVSIPFPGQLPVYLSILGVDFDIAILQGKDQKSGPILASSSSITDNYEIVEFTPPVTGWYSVRIDHNGTMSTSVPEPWGLAWSQESDRAPFSLVERVVDDGVLLDKPMMPGRKLAADFHAPHFPKQTYLIIPSSTPSSIPVPGGILPIGYDIFTATWLNLLAVPGSPWQNTFGVLDAEGRAPAPLRFAIPQHPALANQDLYHVPTILGADAQSNPKFDPIGNYNLMPIGGDTATHELESDQGAVIQLPFAFTYFGQSYTQCFVNGCGTISFGAVHADSTPTSSEMANGVPLIAPLWDGFQGPTRVVSALCTNEVIKEAVFYFSRSSGTQRDLARVTLRSDGEIEIAYGPCDLFRGIAGLRPGASTTTPAAIDFSKCGGHLSVTHDPIFEDWANFTAGFDLGPEIHGNGITAYAHWNKLTFVPKESGFFVDVSMPALD